MVKFHLGSVQDLRLWVGRFANTGTHVLWSKHGINVGKRPCRRWHQPMSKTVTICRFPFLFINFLVDFLWKGHIKIAKSSVLLQQNCYFVCPFLQRCPSFSFFFKHKVCHVCWGPCLWGFAPHSSIHVLPKFWKVLSAVFVCATALELDFFNQSHCLSKAKACVLVKNENLAVDFLPKCMTYVWKCKRTYSSVAWKMCGSARERYYPTPPHAPKKTSTRPWLLLGVDTPKMG